MERSVRAAGLLHDPQFVRDGLPVPLFGPEVGIHQNIGSGHRSGGAYLGNQFHNLAVRLSDEFKVPSVVRRHQLAFDKSIHGIINTMMPTHGPWGVTLPCRSGFGLRRDVPELGGLLPAGLVAARLVAPLRCVARGAWCGTARFFATDLGATGLGLGDGAGVSAGGWFFGFHDPTVRLLHPRHNTPLANPRAELVQGIAALRPNPCASAPIAGRGPGLMWCTPLGAKRKGRDAFQVVRSPTRVSRNSVEP